jgi:hypothetical protein
MTVGYRVIKIEPGTVKSLEQDQVEKVLNETDEEIMARMRDRFGVLDEITGAIKHGVIRAAIVSGPPGVGKSFGVEKVLAPQETAAAISGNEKFKKFEIVRGAMSAIGLYQKLYEFAESKHVVVFDDCDSVLLDDVSLNLLKGALDTSKKRVISWNTESRVLSEAGLPNSFEFNGGCIFITNINFDHIRSKKLRDHLAALESRCHYLDLGIDTEREKILRIKQIVADGMLAEYDFEPEVEAEIVQFIYDNKSEMRELSLRMVLKIADLRKAMPSRWVQVAKVSCMK